MDGGYLPVKISDLYQFALNSHLKYNQIRSNKADKNYLLLKLEYYNLSGSLSSISISKYLKKGDKIISTRETQIKTIKNKAGKFPKTTETSKSKYINGSTIYSKIGITTETDWKVLVKLFHQIVQERLNLLEQYLENITKSDNTNKSKKFQDILLHVSNHPLSLDQVTIIPGNNSTNDLHYLPKGVKISIASKSILDQYRELLTSALKKNASISLSDAIPWVYEISPGKCKILKIQNCKQLTGFYTKYRVKTPVNLATVIDWERVYKIYDGLIINPWTRMECSNYLMSLQIASESELSKIISDLALGKLSTGEMEELKKVIWQSNWGKSRGVIWKNFESMKIKLLF